MDFNIFGGFDDMKKWKEFGNWKDFGYLWDRNFTEKHSRSSISSIESETDDFIK